MILSDVLYFSVRATGVPERLKWDVNFPEFPHVVQVAWIYRNVRECHIICPSGWVIPEKIVAKYGISQQQAIQQGEPFIVVMKQFLEACKAAKLLCGHNIYIATSILKANLLRELGYDYYDIEGVEDALYKGKRLDTMRGARMWVDARFPDGRLKFPSLAELWAKCYPGEQMPEGDALKEADTVKRCLPILLGNGILNLRLREYPEKSQKQPK